MPSSRPVKPRRSSVVALTLTWESSRCSVRAIFSRIFAMCGASFGFWAITVASIFSMAYPFWFKSSPTWARSCRLSAPSYTGSVSGKCCPISPRAAAPSSASMIACKSTSASECPRSPSVCGISTPPKMSLRPSTSLCTSYPIPTLIFSPFPALPMGNGQFFHHIAEHSFSRTFPVTAKNTRRLP